MSGLKIVVCDHGINLTQAQCLICQSPQLAEAKARIAALEARCAELSAEKVFIAAGDGSGYAPCSKVVAEEMRSIEEDRAQWKARCAEAERALALVKDDLVAQCHADEFEYASTRRRADKAEADLARIRAAVADENAETVKKVGWAILEAYVGGRTEVEAVAKAALAVVRESL